jgi:microcystin-dependent protein
MSSRVFEVDMNRPTPRILLFAALALAPLADALACADDLYLGSVCATAANRCPKNTLPADGQILPVAGNGALFSLLLNTYGGNGTTTFALPDLRGRVVVNGGQGVGLANREMGQRLGDLDLRISEANLPAHNHPASSEATVALTLRAKYSYGWSTDPSGKTFAGLAIYGLDPYNRLLGYSSLPADVDMDASALKVSGTVTTTLASVGGGQPIAFGNTQPTLAMTYCIVTDGRFPNHE